MPPIDPPPAASEDLLSALSQSLRTAEEWRATLIDAIESVSEAFGLFDADDRLILCNRRYAQTFTVHDDSPTSPAGISPIWSARPWPRAK